ncbi:MAG: YadA-like family protein [Fusobacterium sp.]|uniref:YadA-like family protein n=1 Tax=Fusobacterium sp. TaxID=68766 RepID=UPI002A763B4C|nr:YadA-like family protein [Fusobacterium sp.]MDY3060317.1 YadA-like family protein [Fusobacterium sp.]
MNKKFMVVALMAALSTVGYAEVTLEQKVEENRVIATQAQNNAAHALIQNSKQDKDIAALDKNKVDKDTYEEDKKAQADKDAAQDAEIAKGDRIDKVQNQQIGALQTENVEQNNKIEALDKNKVDKNTYEEDKKAQADKDAAQDAEIAKGDRIDKVQNQQIGNLQSQNIAQDKNIQANKDAIAENKNQIAANKAEQDKVNAEQKENNKQQQEAIEANKGNIAANRVDIDKNRDDITALQQNFDRYEGRLSGLEKKVDHLDDKMNKGLSLMAAMNAVDFQNVQTGEMALGAGIGHYGNAQSVALGVAYAPVEDLTVNAKYSITAGDADSFAVGAGATYKFKVGR